MKKVYNKIERLFRMCNIIYIYSYVILYYALSCNSFWLGFKLSLLSSFVYLISHIIRKLDIVIDYIEKQKSKEV